jgi:hypothetical protein
MASSAIGMIDTAGMLENEVSMMHNLADGDAYKEAFDEMKGKLADEDLIDDSGY